MPTRLGRRGVLAGSIAGAAAALLPGCARRTAQPGTAAADVRRLAYGPDPSQVVDLRLPGGPARGTVVLLHGGYWQPQYGLEQLDDLAATLTSAGWATANVEYRRTGAGGGVPATLEDVAAAIDLLAEQPEEDVPRGPVALGHSAGGHLAAWAASRSADLPGGEPRVRLAGAVSLSGVLDLSRAATVSGSARPVTAFVGGTPDDVPDAYAVSDPALLVPRCPVWAVHATDDDVVPLEQSERYVAAVSAGTEGGGRGGRAELVTVPGDHFSVVDAAAPSWPCVEQLLDAAAATR